MNETKQILKLSNETYDILKWVAQILLPAIGTAYFALSTIWGFPAGEQIIGTITAIDVFLGVTLGISSSSYASAPKSYDGAVIVNSDNPALDTYKLEFEKPLDELTGKPTLLLEVRSH